MQAEYVISNHMASFKNKEIKNNTEFEYSLDLVVQEFKKIAKSNVSLYIDTANYVLKSRDKDYSLFIDFLEKFELFKNILSNLKISNMNKIERLYKEYIHFNKLQYDKNKDDIEYIYKLKKDKENVLHQLFHNQLEEIRLKFYEIFK